MERQNIDPHAFNRSLAPETVVRLQQRSDELTQELQELCSNAAKKIEAREGYTAQEELQAVLSAY